MWGCDTYKAWRATDREVEIQYLAGGFVKYFWTILNLTKYCNENWRMKSSRCLCDSLSSVLNMICVGRILQRIQSVYWESAVCLSLKKVNVLNSLVITFFFYKLSSKVELLYVFDFLLFIYFFRGTNLKGMSEKKVKLLFSSDILSGIMFIFDLVISTTGSNV